MGRNASRIVHLSIPARRLLPRARSVLLAAVALVALGLPALAGPGDAIIDNGTVRMGVHCEGHLNVPGGTPSSGTGTTLVGLRYVPTNADAISPGCLCEGWGASGDGTSGFANEDEEGATNLSNVTCSQPSPDSFESIVDVGGVLRVKHLYRPSRSPFLYEGVVTITNIGEGGLESVKYRRVMDWDAEPTAFSEFVTVDGGTSTRLIFSSDDGFGTADPLGPQTQINFSGNAVDDGPVDHGAMFDFELGGLAPGASHTFRIYYGAAGTEADAQKALGVVGAEVYSFGQPNTVDGPTLGTPNTFIFGASRVGGSSIFQSSGVPLPEVGEEGAAIGAKSRTGSATAFAGDLDPGAGPNFDDYLAGAPGFSEAGAEEVGAVGVYLGSDDPGERATADVVFVGESPHDRLGVAVAANFDFDGDGKRDLLLGAEQVNRTGVDDPVNGCAADSACGPGKAYLIYWDPADYPNLGNPAVQDRVDLADLNMPGKPRGVVFTGASLGDQAGFAVAAGGPVGAASVRPDIAIGAPGRDVPVPGEPDRVDAGTVYLIFNTGQPDNFDPSGRFLAPSYSLDRVACTHLPSPCAPADELAGIVYLGESGPGPGDTMGDQLGFSVAFPGDIVEPDGPDLAMGAPGTDRIEATDQNRLNSGSAFGSGQSASGIIEVCEIGAPPAVDDGIPGVQILGDQDGEQYGYFVAGAGDHLFNGQDDFLVGAPFWDLEGPTDQDTNAGRASQTGSKLSSGIIEVCEIGAPPAVDQGGIEGVIWTGAQAGDLFGSSGIGIGDVTGNGGDDLVMGAPRTDPDGLLDAGTVYFVEGPDVIADQNGDLFLGERSVNKIGVSISGRQLHGTSSDQESGASVTPLGDHNGDGSGDFAAGCPGRNDDDGVVCTVLETRDLAVQTNEPPTANASASDTLVECSGNRQGRATLDGSLSSDPDSTPGTNDDITDFDWSEGAAAIGSGEVLSNVAFGLGAHPVTLEVTDLAGASDTDTFTLTVSDTLAPDFTACPPDTTAECSGNREAFVTLPPAEADDRCDNGVSIANDATGGGADASGTYPLGDTTVTFTATDNPGNANDTCRTKVTVRDTVAPTLECPAALDLLGPECLGSRDVPLDAVTASDACDTPAVGADPAAVACAATRTVFYTATDAGDNTASCPVEVAVDCPGPSTQGYWHRQCLGVPAREGGIDPGRNGRGPSAPTEPGFKDELMPCADMALEDLGFFGELTCEGMDADPPSDKCEQALKQLTALVLNDCSRRVDAACGVDVSAQGCSSTDLGSLMQEIADLIHAGACNTARACAQEINEGDGLLAGGGGAPPADLSEPVGPGEDFTPVAPRRRALRGAVIAAPAAPVPSPATATAEPPAGAPRESAPAPRARRLREGLPEALANPAAAERQDAGSSGPTAGDPRGTAFDALWARLDTATGLDERFRILRQLAGPGVDPAGAATLLRELREVREAAHSRGDRALVKQVDRAIERLLPVAPDRDEPTSRPRQGGRRAPSR